MVNGYPGAVSDLKVLIGLIFGVFAFGRLAILNGEFHPLPKRKLTRITLFR
jgi:hypothetical protein